jgi:hypothetical protein
LEAPDDPIPDDLLTAKFPPVPRKINSKQSLTKSEITEVITLMSDQTIETIMFTIFKTQMEIEKENANVAEGTFSKYLDIQKLQQNALEEIKDALIKDQKVAQYLQKAQKIAGVASICAQLLAAATGYGALNPLIASLGPTAGQFFLYVAQNVAPILAGGLYGSAILTKAYHQSIENENQAKHENYSYQDRYYQGRVEDIRNCLLRTAEADTVVKEKWLRFLKRCDKIIHKILSRK